MQERDRSAKQTNGKKKEGREGTKKRWIRKVSGREGGGKEEWKGGREGGWKGGREGRKGRGRERRRTKVGRERGKGGGGNHQATHSPTSN